MLKELTFRDLYLGEENCWLSGVPNTRDPAPAPAECAEELKEIRTLCNAIHRETKRQEFSVKFKETVYRASRLESLSEGVFVLRRFPDSVKELSALGIHHRYVELLMTPNLTGLVVVAGAYGQGKKDHRIRDYCQPDRSFGRRRGLH